MNTRTECSPRIVKRKNVKEKTDDALKYEFYRKINHLSIIMLDNEADKLNYSSWLTRLDNESSDLKMHLIKILFISLRSDTSFQIFLKPPPDDLTDLELRSDNTMDMIKWLQDNNIVDETSTNEEKKQEIKHKRSAAVATNLRSYTTIKSSPYFVQSFYVRSDWPIYTWYNPTSIRVPSNYDHNQWELFLNRFQIVTEDKKDKSKHRNECDDIIPIDQISKEVAGTFNWHPYSILSSEENRPKRTAASIVVDMDIANHLCNQQQIDDAAFAIVFCKGFPGNKILSQKMYSDILIPDAKFIFKMTGVTIVDYSNLKLKKDENLPFTCKLKQRKRPVKNRCGVKEKTLCPCEKPMMTIDCSKVVKSSCSTVVAPKSPCSAQNAKQSIQTKPSTNTISITNKNTNTVNTESDCKFGNLNMTYQECKSNSKCLKRSVKKTKSVESCKFPKKEDLDINDNNECKVRKNCSTILNAGRSLFNKSSNHDWTVSSVEISLREPNHSCSSTPPPAAKAPNCNAECSSTPPPAEKAPNCNAKCSSTPKPPAEKAPNCNTKCSSTPKPPAEKAPNCNAKCSNTPPPVAKAPNCSSTPSPAAKAPNCNANCSTSEPVTRVEPEDQSARNCSSVQKTPATPPCQRPGTAESVREPPQERHDCKNSERTENGGWADAIFGCDRRRSSPGQRMSAPQPRDRCASAPRGPKSDDGRRLGQCPVKDQNRSCPATFAEYRPPTPMRPDTSDRSGSQQQHESSRRSSDNRSDIAPTAADWDPEVSSYSVFSGRHMAEDRSRFLTSERTIDDRRRAATPSRSSSPLPQLLPANDFHSAAAAAAANNDNDLSGDSFGAESDWSDELGFDRCQSNRFGGIGDDNNYDTASSLSTLTSSDSSINIRIAARQPLGNVNYERRTDNLLSNSDRYPYDGSLTPNLSEASLQRGGHAASDVWPPAYDLVEDVSMPGSLVTGPWSLSMSGSRSGRVREFGDAGAPDRYDTSCSEDSNAGNASGQDDYGRSETDDVDAGDAAPLHSRNY